MRVAVEIEEVVLQNKDDHYVEGFVARCSRCQHETESFGTSERAVKRCLALLREECPNDENNFYVEEGE